MMLQLIWFSACSSFCSLQLHSACFIMKLSCAPLPDLSGNVQFRFLKACLLNSLYLTCETPRSHQACIPRSHSRILLRFLPHSNSRSRGRALKRSEISDIRLGKNQIKCPPRLGVPTGKICPIGKVFKVNPQFNKMVAHSMNSKE